MQDAIDVAGFWAGFRLIESGSLSVTQLLLRLEPDERAGARCGLCLAPCGIGARSLDTPSARAVSARPTDVALGALAARRLPGLRGVHRACAVAACTQPIDGPSNRSRRGLAAASAHAAHQPAHRAALTRPACPRRPAAGAGGATAGPVAGARRLVMDEFALFKGHRYATVVLCADTQQVLWVA